MPKFAYAAIDTAGAPVEGVTKADTIGAARAILVEQNLFPTKIEERRGMLDFELTKEKVKKKELRKLRNPRRKNSILAGRRACPTDVDMFKCGAGFSACCYIGNLAYRRRAWK